MSKLKYGMATVGAIAVSVGVVGLSFPQARAEHPMGTAEASDAMDQQSWIAQRAKQEYGLLKQECETLHYSQPQVYEQCLEKAKSTRENLLTQAQGSEHTGQGLQGSASNQSGQSGQKQGPIDKVASVVKEKLVDWGLTSPDQGRGGQPSAGQQGQGSGQGFGQGRNPLQADFNAGQAMQGQDVAQQSFGGGSGQATQNAPQQGFIHGQQFGQQGQPGQGSFQGGNYGQQPQGQQQGTGGPNQQFQSQSGGTQGLQGSPSPQGASTSGSAGEEEEHMDSVKYYQELARQQYATLKQECNALKRDPNVYEQCQTYAKSVRDKIKGMAEQNADATQQGSNQRGS
ncbi:MAG: hypothetical protein ACREXX_04100 [Gammaproteobacteria bacterium]